MTLFFFSFNKMKRKAQQQLTGFALTLVVFAVVLAVGLTISSKLYQNECQYGWSASAGRCLNSTGGTAGSPGDLTASYNSTTAMVGYMGEIPGWIPVIIVAFIGGVVLFLVIKQFGGK